MPSAQPGQLFVISLLDHSAWYSDFTIRHRIYGARWTLCRTLAISLVIDLLFVHARAQTEVHSPCMGCRLFNHLHSRYPEKDKKETQFCHYPCQCQEELTCQDGVSEIKDGCSCCFMCARQMGDMCSTRDLCDAAKGLYCDRKDTNSTGICKGRDKNPCMVDGVVYKDGEKFQPECSQLCTCQNGFYGCVNTCPQELLKPSEQTCHEPKLIQVKNNCCKEWTCQKMEASGTSVLAINRLMSDNLVLHNPMWHHTSTLSPLQETTSLAIIPFQQCYKKTTDWTPCSVTCDVGVSIRIVVDPMTCNTYQELLLCYLRPCEMKQVTKAGQKCTPTLRHHQRLHIRYQDCLSIRAYRLKFCTNCKKNKCCYPHRIGIRSMDFQCSDGKRETYNYIWIKKCQCDRTCDLRMKPSRGRGQGRRRRRGKKRRLQSRWRRRL